jgi:hypothetical protein
VDKKLVGFLDEKYLSLTMAPNPTDELESLPEIDEIKTSKVTVSVNLDSSAIAETIKNGAIAVGGAVAGGVAGLATGAIIAAFHRRLRRDKARESFCQASDDQRHGKSFAREFAQ